MHIKLKIGSGMKAILLSLVFLLALFGCNNSSETKKNEKEEHNEPVVEINKEEIESAKKENTLEIAYDESKKSLQAYYDLPEIKEFYEWMNLKYQNPAALEYPADLSKLDYEQIRLLRNEIFARNGYLFSDGYLRGYFNRYKWYMPIFGVDTFKVVLNQEEKELIDKLQAEEIKRKETMFTDKDGLKLFNADLIVNKQQYSGIPSALMSDLQNSGFSIVDANRSMPFYVYDKNAYQYIPHYITTDLYLFILHKYFSCFLEKYDQNYLAKQLRKILESAGNELKKMNSSINQKSVAWAQMYNSLASYAIGDNAVDCPESYKSIFKQEKANMDSQSGGPSFIPNTFVSYTELKPRGHYTRNDTLKKYFRCFKWISLNGIDIDNDAQFKGLLTFAYAIKSNSSLKNEYEHYISAVEKIAGEEDNLSLADVINVLDGNTLDDVLSDTQMEIARCSLKAGKEEKIKKVFGESFKTKEREAKRVYFLSGTYSISGDIFSKLVHVDGVNSKRPFPRGLDVPAVFGNQTAQRIITEEYKDSETWSEYIPRLKQLQKQFKDFKDWNSNYGFKGVQTALAANAEQSNYPDFMKTDAYNRKELSTTLSSWTHIKHDLILYQEKPYAAECGQGGGPEPPLHYSYVEPNVAFWNAALDLVKWLEKFSVQESTFDSQLRRIEKLGVLLRDVAQKELDGQTVTQDEFDKLHYVGGTIEYTLLALLETDHLPDREKSMGLIADVYAYNGDNLNVAVGHADDIYVVVPIKGEYYIARGSVFSYYEFVGEIYNDEEWKSKIERGNLPERPEWIKPLVEEVKTPEGQMQFRY